MQKIRLALVLFISSPQQYLFCGNEMQLVGAAAQFILSYSVSSRDELASYMVCTTFYSLKNPLLQVFVCHIGMIPAGLFQMDKIFIPAAVLFAKPGKLLCLSGFIKYDITFPQTCVMQAAYIVIRFF